MKHRVPLDEMPVEMFLKEKVHLEEEQEISCPNDANSD